MLSVAGTAKVLSELQLREAASKLCSWSTVQTVRQRTTLSHSDTTAGLGRHETPERASQEATSTCLHRLSALQQVTAYGNCRCMTFMFQNSNTYGAWLLFVCRDSNIVSIPSS